MNKDFYAILESEPTASEMDLKLAYRRLAKKYHPDINPDDKIAEENFKKISEAWETLGNSDKRLAYDNSRAPKTYDRPPNGYGYGDLNFDDMFTQWGQDFSNYKWAAPPKGKDITVMVALTFEEMYKGCSKDIIFSMGTVRVNIKAGSGAGDKFRVPGKGEKSMNPDGERGDAILIVKEISHSLFTRKEDTLIYKLKLGFADLVLGTSVIIPHLDGKLKLNVPKNMEPGSKLKLAGKGFNKGDMEIELQLYMPKTLSKAEHELLEKIKISPNFNELNVK